MSNSATSTSPDAPVPEIAETLDDLRAEIDALDDAVHDLLMRRANAVERVGRLRTRGKVPYRPGREARIVRRLLARHKGPLPPRTLARLWREVFAGFIAIETRFTVAVCDPASPAPGPLAVAAREHFGALTPLHAHRSPAQAIAEVSAATATVAVLPMPVEEESASQAWWVALLYRDEPRIHVVARLPFWAAPRPDGAVTVEALVVAASAPDASGVDRALLGVEIPPEMSRARLITALTEAGLPPGGILLRRDAAGGPAHGLIDLAGALDDDDPRLPALARCGLRPVVLGGYAVPLEWAAP